MNTPPLGHFTNEHIASSCDIYQWKGVHDHLLMKIAHTWMEDSAFQHSFLTSCVLKGQRTFSVRYHHHPLYTWCFTIISMHILSFFIWCFAIHVYYHDVLSSMPDVLSFMHFIILYMMFCHTCLIIHSKCDHLLLYLFYEIVMFPIGSLVHSSPSLN